VLRAELSARPDSINPKSGTLTIQDGRGPRSDVALGKSVIQSAPAVKKVSLGPKNE
jgi:hypothetical protein